MKKRIRIQWILLLFLSTLPMMASAAYFYSEVTTSVSSTGARPAISIDSTSSELYYTRGTTTTYTFNVKNSDEYGQQGEVKLSYTLEFQMPITTGVTYSLKKGNTVVPLTASGVTGDNRPIFKTGAQTLGVSAQSDTWTLTMNNASSRSASVLDTMNIIVHAQQVG